MSRTAQGVLLMECLVHNVQMVILLHREFVCLCVQALSTAILRVDSVCHAMPLLAVVQFVLGHRLACSASLRYF